MKYNFKIKVTLIFLLSFHIVLGQRSFFFLLLNILFWTAIVILTEDYLECLSRR
jgi:hypothetical protein